MIATATKVEVKGVDGKVLSKVSEPKYWERERCSQKKGEDAFFKQGEKPEVCYWYNDHLHARRACGCLKELV